MAFEPAAGASLTVKDEGITIATGVDSLDFAGAGVSGAAVGSAVTETIGGGGAGTPGGADTYVQFNDGGAFGGVAGLAFNKTNITFSIGGSDAMTVNGSAVSTRLALHTADSATASALEMHMHSDTASRGAIGYFARTRGTEGSPNAVQSGDTLGQIDAIGFDGTDFALSSSIEFEVDGTPGANDMPGRIVFKTAADGTQTLTERMRIEQNGYVGIGTAGAASAPLHLVGSAGLGQLIAAGTATTNVNALSITQTWNNAGVTFTAIKANITDTTSNASSILMDLQVGSDTKFMVRKDATHNKTWFAGNNGNLQISLGGSGGMLLGATDVTIGTSVRATAGKLNVTSGTITTDLNNINGTATWNAAGVTFTGWELNITDTASAAASLLMDLQTGGTSKLKLRKDGYFTNTGGHVESYTSTSSTSYTVLDTDYIILLTSSSARTVNLPAAASYGGRVLHVKDQSGSAATANITIDGNASETIDGATTYVLRANYASLSLVCDGSNWYVI
jgi:hypothetical protein